MLLDPHSASLAPRSPAPPRQWHPCEKAPLPRAEPGVVLTNAAVNVTRHANGMTTAGDDRLEQRCNRLRRLLWASGHGKRSGRFETSIWQLVEALAPSMGWGPVPPKDHPDRRRFMRAHARNVRFWLEHLQGGGIITFEPEADNRGQDWRTIITLLNAPDPPPDELAAAQRRHKAFKARRRIQKRRRQAHPERTRRGRLLEHIRRDCARPQAGTRRRLAIARACAIKDHREAKVAAAAAAAACDPSLLLSEHRAHLVKACPSDKALQSENVSTNTNVCSDSTGVTRARVAEPPEVCAALKGRALKTASMTKARPAGASTVAKIDGAALSRMTPEELQDHVAALTAARRPREELVASHATRRAAELAVSKADRGWPAWRLKEAWVVWRRGADVAGEHGPGQAGPLEPGDLELLARAVGRYEQHAARRAPGWPAGGYGALEQIARRAREHDTRPLILHWAIIELDHMSVGMQAIARADDPDRFAGMIARARRRRQPPAPGPLSFRTASPWPAWTALDEHGAPILTDDGLQILDVPGAPDRSDERYRDTLRDAYLVAGLWPPPESDGVAQRALNAGTYDVELGERRVRPGPYHAPPGTRPAADPADIELARLTAIDLQTARRLDVDERDRRLADARRDRAEQTRADQHDLWTRLATRPHDANNTGAHPDRPRGATGDAS